MANDRRLQGMPEGGQKGAPDGVNTQGEEDSPGANKSRARRQGPLSKDKGSFGGGAAGHGGSSVIGYHGPQQLGDQDVKPGGNQNAGAKSK